MRYNIIIIVVVCVFRIEGEGGEAYCRKACCRRTDFRWLDAV